MWVFLFLASISTANADTTLLPQKPEKSGAKPGQCPQAYAVKAGQVPKFTTCPSTCSGVLLPTSIAADYVKIDSWGDSIFEACNQRIIEQHNEIQSMKTVNKAQRVVVAGKYAAGGVAVGIIIGLLLKN